MQTDSSSRMHAHNSKIETVLLAGATAVVFCRSEKMQTGAICMHIMQGSCLHHC